MIPKNAKALIVVTSHGSLGPTGRPTGYYLTEVAHMYKALVEEGFEVDIASPKGGKAPVDPQSIKLEDTVVRDFWENPATRAKLSRTYWLSDIDPGAYGAILFAGGHGTMWDFPENKEIQRIIQSIYEREGVVGAVCHGPAALVNVVLRDGTYLLAGKQVAGFTNDEEVAVHKEKLVPFALETKLKERGATFVKAPEWQTNVVAAGRIVTGQNPASAYEVGRRVATLLHA
jgi:putative intracellular protease/amidase